MTAFRNDNIHTVVSRPGPIERRVLEGLAPAFQVHRRVGAGVSLRTLEGGEGSGSLVFLHGRGHAATIFAPLLARFAKSHRVTAVDLPGFGHSGAAPFDGSDGASGLRFFAEPIEDLLSSSRAPLTLVGHSLGGLVALAVTLGGRAPVERLVLLDAMGLGPAISSASRLYLRSSPERIARLKSVLSLGGPPRDELAALRVELLTVRGGRPQASRAFDAMVPLVGPAFHLAERLGEVEAQTLVVWGARDEAFPLSVAEMAVRSLPRAELVTLDAAHSPHLEAPSLVGDALEAWLLRARA